MSWTTERTWVAGEVVTAAMLNTHLRDNANFLYNPEFAYSEITADTTISATSGTPLTLIGPTAGYTFDGTTVAMVRAYVSEVDIPGNAGGNQVVAQLLEDSTAIGTITLGTSTASVATQQGVDIERRRTPAAGSHTYTLKVYRTNANATALATTLPAFVRVTAG